MKGTKIQQSGFTLIEVLIVVALIGILSAIAFPSYLEYAKSARRSDGQLALLGSVQALERCRVTAYAYTNCNLDSGGLTQDSPEGNYTITLTRTASTYLLTAAPKGKQASDSHCASMTINQLGVKGATNADCWN